MTIATVDMPDDEAARILIDRQMLKYDGPTPAIVTNIATGGQSVDAQPAIDQTVILEGVRSAMPRAEVRGAPVMMYGSTTKGIFICPPISSGDDGVLFPMMRALDNWQHGEGNRPPPDMQTPRHSDLSDSVFYPGVLRSSGEIANYPSEAMTIQDVEGSTVLSIKPGEIKATVGAVSITIDAAGIHIVGPVDIQGLLALAGDLGQQGNQLIVGTVTANQFITAP